MINKQPEALRLAAWLKEGAWHQMRLGDVEAAGRELVRQHAALERKDALLRQALGAVKEYAEYDHCVWLTDAITKELAK